MTINFFKTSFGKAFTRVGTLSAKLKVNGWVFRFLFILEVPLCCLSDSSVYCIF